MFRPSQLRPESLGYLLDLIGIIMGKEATSFLPLERLDVAQVILLRWGGTVPWSWSTWTDQRSADTEYLCSMVIIQSLQIIGLLIWMIIRPRPGSTI